VGPDRGASRAPHDRVHGRDARGQHAHRRPPPLASDATAEHGGATGSTAAGDAPPAWKTPPASGLPPAWGDPDAEQDGPGPTNQAKNLWGLVPEDHPEVLLGVALAGGVLAAIILRSLAKR
jgi:hypothetical protein